jgi:hypothetical protein
MSLGFGLITNLQGMSLTTLILAVEFNPDGCWCEGELTLLWLQLEG